MEMENVIEIELLDHNIKSESFPRLRLRNDLKKIKTLFKLNYFIL